MNICSIDGCEKQVKGHGLCDTHYMRKRRTGSPHTVRPPGIPGNSRKNPLYKGWAGMVNRCHNPTNSSYGRYGGRGIFVCDRWRHGEGGRTGFECFLDDMGPRPDGKTLDRYPDPAGPYAPDNCRWATTTEQRQNITPEGDRRMRDAMSVAVTRRWERWREQKAKTAE